MSTAVRYYSKTGHTKAVAEAIAKAAGVEAVSVDAADAKIQEPVDVLFIGAAIYAYGLDKNMKEYLATLKKGDAGKAVVFSTSWVSKHGLDLIRKELVNAGIPVAADTFYVRNKPNEKQLAQAGVFAKKYL